MKFSTNNVEETKVVVHVVIDMSREEAKDLAGAIGVCTYMRIAEEFSAKLRKA